MVICGWELGFMLMHCCSDVFVVVDASMDCKYAFNVSVQWFSDLDWFVIAYY